MQNETRDRMLRIAGFCLLLAGICSQASAAQVNVGLIGVFGDTPFTGFQQVQVLNLTPGDCSTTNPNAFAVPCDNINITNWAVTIDYIDNITTPGTPILQHVSGSGALIAPGATVSLYGGLQYSIANTSCGNGATPAACDTVVTRVVFTGSLPSGGFHVLAPGSSVQSLFLPLTPFSIEYDPAAIYQDGTQSGDSTNLLLADNPLGNGGGGGGGGVPEPSTVMTMLGGALALGFRRFIKH